SRRIIKNRIDNKQKLNLKKVTIKQKQNEKIPSIFCHRDNRNDCNSNIAYILGFGLIDFISSFIFLFYLSNFYCFSDNWIWTDIKKSKNDRNRIILTSLSRTILGKWNTEFKKTVDLKTIPVLLFWNR